MIEPNQANYSYAVCQLTVEKCGVGHPLWQWHQCCFHCSMAIRGGIIFDGVVVSQTFSFEVASPPFKKRAWRLELTFTEEGFEFLYSIKFTFSRIWSSELLLLPSMAILLWGERSRLPQYFARRKWETRGILTVYKRGWRRILILTKICVLNVSIWHKLSWKPLCIPAAGSIWLVLFLWVSLLV